MNRDASDGFAIAEVVLKLAKSAIKDKISEAKAELLKEQTNNNEDVLPAGSDSCTVCGKVEPKDSMNNRSNNAENYHGGKIQTQGTNKVQKDKTP